MMKRLRVVLSVCEVSGSSIRLNPFICRSRERDLKKRNNNKRPLTVGIFCWSPKSVCLREYERKRRYGRKWAGASRALVSSHSCLIVYSRPILLARENAPQAS